MKSNLLLLSPLLGLPFVSVTHARGKSWDRSIPNRLDDDTQQSFPPTPSKFSRLLLESSGPSNGTRYSQDEPKNRTENDPNVPSTTSLEIDIEVEKGNPSITKGFFTVTIQMDNFPSETGWKLEVLTANFSAAETVQGADPGFYTGQRRRALVTKDIDVVVDALSALYRFTMIDSWGDGLSFPGYYALSFTSTSDPVQSANQVVEATFDDGFMAATVFSVTRNPESDSIEIGFPLLPSLRTADEKSSRNQLFIFPVISLFIVFAIHCWCSRTAQQEQLTGTSPHSVSDTNGIAQQQNHQAITVGAMDLEQRRKYIADNLPVFDAERDKQRSPSVVSSSVRSWIASSLRMSSRDGSLCAICLTNYGEGDKICLSKNPNCKHKFHAHCMASWLERHEQCPCCRRNYLEEDAEP